MQKKIKNEKQMIDLGKEIASKLKGGDIVLLYGDLGAGKTTLTKGIASYFGINDIVSPTFTLMQTYEVESIKYKVESRKLRIGVPKEYFDVEGMDEEVKKIIEDKIGELGKNKQIEIISVSLPMTKYAIPVYYIVVPSEDSSNLGRLDGIRYGIQSKDADSLYDIYAKSRAEGFPEEVKRRIMIGTYALSAGYYDAYYKKAQKVRTLIRQDFDRVFSDPAGSGSDKDKIDLLLTSTSPFPAFGLGEKKDDVLAMYLADVFVAPAALAGLPAISIPAGKTKAGLPVGLQIIGPRMSEDTIFNFAKLI